MNWLIPVVVVRVRPRVAAWDRLAYPDPAYRAGVFARWDAAVAGAAASSGEIEPMACRVTHKDGQAREIDISTSIIDGLLVSAFVDVTERRRAETGLAAKEAELLFMGGGAPPHDS